MINESHDAIEETLDPDDWEAMRALGHRMVDDMMTYLAGVRERPVWQPVPEEVRQRFDRPLPVEPEAPDRVYEEFLRDVLPYPMGNIHPRFWGWVIGTGTPFAMLSEMLAAGMNPNVGGGDHIAGYVERQVVDWCGRMLGFPESSSGLLVSGGSMANLVGLTVARHAGAGFDVRTEGVRGGPGLTAYGSVEMHSSVQKAMEMLGLGNNALRRIPVDAEFRIDLEALRNTIAADREAGLRPFCVIGNAGAVATGAIDDLTALADLCDAENLWFHVDGAFGALAAVAPELRPLMAGMERADSLAFDLHKWLYIPFEAGCILVRDPALHRRAFALSPDYLAHSDRGISAGGNDLWFSDFGIQLSRGFRALKVWMSLKEHGTARYGRLIAQNADQARYLAGLVQGASDLELLAPVPLNIVCFRYKVDGLDQARLNELNTELLIRLQESGLAVPTSATVRGNYAIRVAIVNHRSRREDFDLLVEGTRRIGAELADEFASHRDR